MEDHEHLNRISRKAIFLSRLGRREEAMDAACASISLFKWNWSLWQLLGSMITNRADVCNHHSFIHLHRLMAGLA